jgi:acetolactate synthase-1/2/3 large subunit
MITNGWSGMGFGIPAAIASALNMPDIPVVCVSGDGGFLMTCGELITARRMNLGVLFIILADRELNLIRLKEQRRGHEPMAVDICEDKLIGEKSFLGVPVISCYDESTLRDTLTGLFPMKGPLLLELYIDASDYQKLVIS